MEPSDDVPRRPVRPPPPPLPYERLRARAEQGAADLRRRWAERADRRAGGRAPRATPFVPASETVVLDVRRHGLVLLWPAVRTLTGLLALAGSTFFGLLFAASTAAWAWQRLSGGAKRSAVAVALAAVLLFLVSPVWAVLALGLWLAEDVADWSCDRLVVSDRRVYRRYGWATAHAPSISLTAVAFIDAAVPPLGRVLGYGTLRLDSVAQRDAPLSRLDFLPDVIGVSHELLRLRAAAMPASPPPTLY
ncbi:MAG TPA: PH domain-containing protein [Mycobacteriales bacterium]|nr:PH domain-containing protein [Mycobacteriales bacterium]